MATVHFIGAAGGGDWFDKLTNRHADFDKLTNRHADTVIYQYGDSNGHGDSNSNAQPHAHGYPHRHGNTHTDADTHAHRDANAGVARQPDGQHSIECPTKPGLA